MKFCIELKKLSLKLKQHQRKSIFKSFFKPIFVAADGGIQFSINLVKILEYLLRHRQFFLQHDEMRKLANICDRETKIASAAKSNQSRV